MLVESKGMRHATMSFDMLLYQRLCEFGPCWPNLVGADFLHMLHTHLQMRILPATDLAQRWPPSLDSHSAWVCQWCRKFQFPASSVFETSPPTHPTKKWSMESSATCEFQLLAVFLPKSITPLSHLPQGPEPGTMQPVTSGQWSKNPPQSATT